MAIVLPNGQRLGDPAAGESTSKLVDQLRVTSNFGVADSLAKQDPTIYNPYQTDHKSSTQVAIFMGPIWVKEAAAIEIVARNTKTPAYPYASAYYAQMIEGKVLVQGKLYMYETTTNAFQADIAKYKALLQQEYVADLKIREIAAQRMNLFGATLENQLLTNIPDPAARSAFINKVINQITTELITGDAWYVPKLTIVSATMGKTEPLIDVYEEIVFQDDAKSIVVDGSTQIRSYGFTARRPVVREAPPKGINSAKWLVDIDATIKSFTDGLAQSIIDGLSINVQRWELPAPLHPNNILYTGSLSDSVVGWGGNEGKGEPLMAASLRFTQEVRNTVQYQGNVVLYQMTSASDGTSVRREGPLKPVPVKIDNMYRYTSPDARELMNSIRVISRSFPTQPTLAFSWLVPPPKLPDVFKLSDEVMGSIQGASLTSSFYSLRMSTPMNDNKERIRAHTPVRSIGYIPTSKFDDKDQFVSYSPIEMTYLLEGARTAKGVHQWYPFLEKKDAYPFEKWFFFGFKVITGNSILNSFLEAITLGLLGNVDGIENYSATLTGFPSLGSPSGGLNNSIDSLLVQTFPVFIDSNKLTKVFAANKDTSGALSTLLFRISSEISRDVGTDILKNGICKDAGCKYLWAVNDIQSHSDPRLTFNMTWDKDAIDSALMDYVGCVVRVASVGAVALPSGDAAAKNDELEDIKGRVEFVAPTSAFMCQKASLDLVTRMDRKFVDYQVRAGDNGGVIGLLLTGVNNLAKYMNNSNKFDISAQAKQLTETLVATRVQQTYFRTQEFGPLKNPPGSIYLTDQRVKNDVVDGISNLVDSLTGINPAGFANQLTRDSKITGGLQVSPKMISGYVSKVRFLVDVGGLAANLTNFITAALETYKGDISDPSVMGAKNGAPNTKYLGQKIKDLTLNSLQFYAQYAGFTYRIANTSELNQFRLDGNETGNGTLQDKTVVILESSTIAPSAFVLDGVHRGKEKEYTRDVTTNPLGIGSEEV